MAINTILSQTSPGSKALVIATDMTRFILEEENSDHTSQDWSFAEPSGGSGAVAMLVSDTPHVFQIDAGANGYYGYEVMDTCRPVPDKETGDSDLSLLAYLECCEKAYLEYEKRVAGIDYVNTFGYLAFHTPFGGMVKGAHRNMMRKMVRATPQDTEADFNRRVAPGLNYCQRVGNIMGATLALSLLSTLSNADIQSPQRIGCFSYGSGCCSEFFSGVVTPEGCRRVRQMDIGAHLDRRRELTMSEYDALLYGNHGVRFGTKNVTLDLSLFPQIHSGPQNTHHLVLSRINEFHREYEWV